MEQKNQNNLEVTIFLYFNKDLEEELKEKEAPLEEEIVIKADAEDNKAGDEGKGIIT